MFDIEKTINDIGEYAEILDRYNELLDKYEELRKKYRRLEKEHKTLQVEHSRLLFDIDAVIEHEVDVKCKKLKERINTMQEFIDYSEWVVQNAIWMLYEEWWGDKALDYLENCYVTGDDKQYEEMERLYKDEN